MLESHFSTSSQTTFLDIQNLLQTSNLRYLYSQELFSYIYTINSPLTDPYIQLFNHSCLPIKYQANRTPAGAFPNPTSHTTDSNILTCLHQTQVSIPQTYLWIKPGPFRLDSCPISPTIPTTSPYPPTVKMPGQNSSSSSSQVRHTPLSTVYIYWTYTNNPCYSLPAHVSQSKITTTWTPISVNPLVKTPGTHSVKADPTQPASSPTSRLWACSQRRTVDTRCKPSSMTYDTLFTQCDLCRFQSFLMLSYDIHGRLVSFRLFFHYTLSFTGIFIDWVHVHWEHAWEAMGYGIYDMGSLTFWYQRVTM